MFYLYLIEIIVTSHQDMWTTLTRTLRRTRNQMILERRKAVDNSLCNVKLLVWLFLLYSD